MSKERIAVIASLILESAPLVGELRMGNYKPEYLAKLAVEAGAIFCAREESLKKSLSKFEALTARMTFASLAATNLREDPRSQVERHAETAFESAKAFGALVGKGLVTEFAARVGASSFAALIAPLAYVNDKNVFDWHAGLAIKLAKEVDALLEAACGGGPIAETPAEPPAGPGGEIEVVDVPLADLPLGNATKELLAAEGLLTAKAILDADAQRPLDASINGVGEKIRLAIVECCTTAIASLPPSQEGGAA